jgi:site-specific recombinase XerD
MLMTLTPLHSPIASIAEKVNDYANHSRADNTVKAYRSDWKHFTNWCAAQAVKALPATSSTVALYITALAGDDIRTSTIQRRLTAISQAHQMAGYESPTKSEAVRTVMKGIRRVHGTAHVGKAPVMTEDVRKMVSMLPDTLIGVRDGALLLIGFAGAFRRSELVGLDVPDIAFTREGVVVTLRRSKTDQEGQGRKVGIPYGSHPHTCPVRALQAWLEASGIAEGALFRSVNRHGQLQPGRLSDKAVALVVKRCAEAAGLDADNYAGHSLRAGLATSAAAAGVSERAIMAQTGHRSVNMVRRYIRDGSLFRENAAACVGL